MSGLELARGLIKVNALINCALVSDLESEEFHQATEGLGLIAQLPRHPDKKQALMLLEALARISGVGQGAPMGRNLQD